MSDEEQSAWRAVFMLLMQLPGPLDAQLRRDAGLTLFEYMVLSSLSMEPGATLSMGELARLASASPSRLSNVVKRCESRGWVVRRPDDDDRRVTVAEITDAGRAVVEAAAPGHVEAVRHYVVEPLTPAQQRSVAAVGRRIETVLDRDCAPTRSPVDDG